MDAIGRKVEGGGGRRERVEMKGEGGDEGGGWR